MCSLQKRGSIYILTLTGDGEHRLDPTLIDSIQAALSRLREEPASPCSALVTTAHGKYFCNGFDFGWAKSNFKFMIKQLESLVSNFFSLPMPTIAAITGHVSAAGVALALSHDYILMRRDRGFLYLNEIDIGFEIPNAMMVFLKSKISDARVRQEVIMAAAKLTADMAVVRGIVHSAHDSAEETVNAAIRLAEGLVRRRWNGDVYARNRSELYRDAMDKFSLEGGGMEEKIKKIKTKSKL